MDMRLFARALAPLRRRVLLTIGRAVLQLVDDARKLQSVQVVALDGEVIDDAERFQQYGYTSHPHPGAEAVLLSVGGMRQHPIVIAVEDRRYRQTGLVEGEVCLYTSENESGNRHRVILRRGRVARIECGGSSIVMDPRTITLTAGDGATMTLGSGAAVTGDALTHNGTNVGDDHTPCPTPASHAPPRALGRRGMPWATLRRERAGQRGGGLMTDLALAWDNEQGLADLCIAGSDFVGDDALSTALLVSLFTDARVTPDELPAGDTDRRGWWGDQVGVDDGPIGSKLWLLDRAKLTNETTALAERYAREAVQWIIDDGEALDIEISASRAGRERMGLVVRIRLPDSRVREFQFTIAAGVT